MNKDNEKLAELDVIRMNPQARTGRSRLDSCGF